MPEGVIEILKAATLPMTRQEIKAKLIEMGVPKKRLGNYYYTALSRLMEREEIERVGEDRLILHPKKGEAPSRLFS